MDLDNDVNIGNNDTEFDESQIPESVRKAIEKRARDGYIPKDRYDKATGKLKDELNRLSTNTEQAPAPATPKYTRAQLRNAVNEGKLDEDQMEEIWSKQVLEEARDQARKEAQSNASTTSTQEKLANTLKAYTDSIEGLNDPDSDNRAIVEEAYEDLVDLHGKPTTALEQQKLEALACRAAFGPVSKLKARVDRMKRTPSSYYEEGNGEDQGSQGSTVNGIPKHLVAYYEPLIARGMYKDWAAVKAELKYASPQVAKRNKTK
jgi:hypothetical protein